MVISDLIVPNLSVLQEASYEISALLAEIDDANNLIKSQALMLYAAAAGLKPDLILDLGTGNGNSAAVFALYARRSGASPRILTFDMSPNWERTVKNKLREFDYLGDAVEPVIGDLTKFNFADVIGPAKSVVVFWDCHGYEIAETVLSSIFPALQHKKNLVICHDIADVRYANFGVSATNYGGNRMWSGMDQSYRRETASLRIGNYFGIVDQLVALTDFTSRNEIELGSCDHEIGSTLTVDQKQQWDELAGNLVSMCWLSLESGRSYHFPPPPIIMHPTAIFASDIRDYPVVFYNIGVKLNKEHIEVTASSQHLASLWISLGGRGLSSLSLNAQWKDEHAKRAPISIQDGNFRVLSPELKEPLPDRVRVLIHPQIPGVYELPSRIELVAHP